LQTKNNISTEKRLVVHKKFIIIPRGHEKLNSKVYKNFNYQRIDTPQTKI